MFTCSSFAFSATKDKTTCPEYRTIQLTGRPIPSISYCRSSSWGKKKGKVRKGAAIAMRASNAGTKRQSVLKKMSAAVIYHASGQSNRSWPNGASNAQST